MSRLLALALLPGDASAVILDVEANHRQQTRVAEGTATSSQWGSMDEAVDAARELFEQGTLQYKLSNYLVALDKFTEAFGVAMTIEDGVITHFDVEPDKFGVSCSLSAPLLAKIG